MQHSAVRESLAGHSHGLEKVFLGLEESRASSLCVLSRNDSALASARFDVDPEKGKGYWEFLRLGNDLFAIVSNVLYPERVTVPVVGEGLIEFHFRLSGNLQLLEGEDTIDVCSGSLLIWRQPKGCDIVEHLSGDGQRESSVTIYCRPSFLQRCFGELAPTLDRELAAALGPSCDSIRSVKATLYPALTKLVVDFASCGDRSGVRMVRAEALAMQIISEVLSNVTSQKTKQSLESRVSDRDVDCLRAARQIIIAHHAPAPTIDVLAKRVGLSPTKLKSGFRLVYGQTISDFANELRMATAKDLLKKSDKPIAHVSAELGYEYQNSFTVAFRRRYGVLPKDYRRDPLAYEGAATLAA